MIFSMPPMIETSLIVVDEKSGGSILESKGIVGGMAARLLQIAKDGQVDDPRQIRDLLGNNANWKEVWSIVNGRDVYRGTMAITSQELLDTLGFRLIYQTDSPGSRVITGQRHLASTYISLDPQIACYGFSALSQELTRRFERSFDALDVYEEAYTVSQNQEAITSIRISKSQAAPNCLHTIRFLMLSPT